MLRPSWFLFSSALLCRSRHSVIRTPAVMSAAYATQSQWVPRPGDQQTPPYHVYPKEIIRSERDERDYRVIRLQNGLEAMLVHDVKADKSAASLDVSVGHLYDPVRYILAFDRVGFADQGPARHARIGSFLRALVIHGILFVQTKPDVVNIVVGNGKVPSGERILRGSNRLYASCTHRLNIHHRSSLRRTTGHRTHIPAHPTPTITSMLGLRPSKAPSLVSRHSSTAHSSLRLVPHAN